MLGNNYRGLYVNSLSTELSLPGVDIHVKRQVNHFILGHVHSMTRNYISDYVDTYLYISRGLAKEI